MIKITAVDPQDLPAILRIERLGFNEAEAGTAAQYQARINQLADTFLAARDADQLVGFIVGPVVDARFKYIEMRVLNILKTGCMKLTYKIALNLAATR